ncbi:hypothetical protein AN478_05990 [Thiohalorhabdus denitrificans]|uniref:Uncharacterized protein n=1 Tax=Thiohalorhabdus denitrificans TaxID=381306 RepID=A0A0P9C747_9GAMM|nr:hypothetical protein [Thiohalorhabdus denitrificans]KPV40705.1 hypothetical protein AN478_05990 [Thiohalorhabdus denitrificans]SCY46487.1 hypothetical protein SAMN05661077_2179 [Thiohalorhabdus denitrificans]
MRKHLLAMLLCVAPSISLGAEPVEKKMAPGYSACFSEVSYLELMRAIRSGDERTAQEVQRRECHVFSHCQPVTVLRRGKEDSVEVRVKFSTHPVWVSSQSLGNACPDIPSGGRSRLPPLPELQAI